MNNEIINFGRRKRYAISLHMSVEDNFHAFVLLYDYNIL